MSPDHLRIENRTEERSLAGLESLQPLPATRGLTSDERSELGDWILWENPVDSGEGKRVKWEFGRVLDVI